MRVYITAIVCIFALSGCASSTLMGISSILSGADVVSQLTTGKGAVDNAVSIGMDKDCAVFRMFKGKRICRDKEVEDLIDMGCEVYAWDEDDKPFCKNEEK